MRKWWWTTPLAVFLLLAGALLPALHPPPQKVTEANSERIKPGMTRAEVEAILGGPPGDYRTRPTQTVDIWMAEGEAWFGDEGDCIVAFDRGVAVAPAFFYPHEPVRLSPLSRFLWRLGLVKKGWEGFP